jgi:demethylmenaquinone methyltransferase/2-methoxy-6-polyprenyl-1,4-benzoquinol methylase
MPTETKHPSPPAWTESDLSENPHANADKARRVERMFAAIAHAYDLNNRLHSMWRDQAWRRAAVKMADLKPTDHVLDVACGTGDLAIAFAEALYPQALPGVPGQVTGIDFTFPMLTRAYDKWYAHGIVEHYHDDPDTNPGSEPFIQWYQGDAMRLPIADKSVDVVSIAFGIRNVADPAAAMREFHRVLRPGGRVIVLEFSTPTNPLIRFFDRIYRERIMPVTASLIARDKSGAYKYLPRSVSTFLDRAAMVELIRSAGFTDPTLKPLTFGVAVCYRGMKR